MRKWTIGLVTILTCLSTVQSALAEESSPRPFSGRYPIKAIATVGMIADPLSRIAGPHLSVTTIIGEGGDPHLYKPSPRDVRRIIESDIVFFNGLQIGRAHV